MNPEPWTLNPEPSIRLGPGTLLQGLEAGASLEQICQSRPDSGLDLSHFQYERPYNHLSCSLPEPSAPNSSDARAGALRVVAQTLGAGEKGGVCHGAPRAVLSLNPEP